MCAKKTGRDSDYFKLCRADAVKIIGRILRNNDYLLTKFGKSRMDQEKEMKLFDIDFHSASVGAAAGNPEGAVNSSLTWFAIISNYWGISLESFILHDFEYEDSLKAK